MSDVTPSQLPLSDKLQSIHNLHVGVTRGYHVSLNAILAAVLTIRASCTVTLVKSRPDKNQDYRHFYRHYRLFVQFKSTNSEMFWL